MKIKLLVVFVVLYGCAPGALVYKHPVTGVELKCDGGGAFLAWEREQRRNLCVTSAIAAGYEIQPEAIKTEDSKKFQSPKGWKDFPEKEGL